MKKTTIISLSVLLFALSACTSLPKESIELSEVTGQQITELHQSHIRFVALYYNKLRDDVNRFIDEKWTPSFIAKAVKHKAFRDDLDKAYITSNINASDLSINWNGSPLPQLQKDALLRGIKQAVTNEKSKLGNILRDWSQEVQNQINKRKKALQEPVNVQEELVISEINAAFIDLQRSQAAIKGYLNSAFELKQKNEQVLQKLGALEKIKTVMNTVTEANDRLTEILDAADDASAASDDFIEQLNESHEIIRNALQKSTTNNQE